MKNSKFDRLQLFAGDCASVPGGSDAGVNAADAGQGAGQAPQEAPARRSWAEVREDYRADFDREVQSIVKKRLRGAQEKLRLAEAGVAVAPARGGTAAAQRLAARREAARAHYDALVSQAEALRGRYPDFDLARELQSDAFAEITRPGSQVSVEQAYFALHPELRLAEAEAVARRAAEAVSEAVRAGAARPRENGAQSASLSSPSHRELSREQREELRRRIYAAGAKGRHLGAESILDL